MSYELEFEAEPFATETSVGPKPRCGCGTTEHESEFGVSELVGRATKAASTIGSAAAGLLSGASRIIDLTAKADKSLRKGTRDPRTVTALVLHQMACCASRKDPLNSYLKIGSHYTILRDGRILQMHPISSVIWASNGFNQRSVAVEFAGNLPDTKGRWWKGEKYGKNQLTRAQVEAGRHLIQHLVMTIGLKHVLAHRQSSGTRTNDPGPDIWFNVGQWAINTLKLSDGGPGFKIDSGAAIPPEWRTWNKPVSGELGEWSPTETELVHDEWPEFEGETDAEDAELRRRGVARRPLRAQRPGSSRIRARPRPRPRPRNVQPRPRPALRRRSAQFNSMTTQPCVCPQHGSENVRWLQSSFNQVLGLRLPVNGIIDAATRSAIRSFQEQRGLQADGIAGPEVRRALIEAKSGNAAAPASDDSAVEPAEPTTAAPSENEMTEFDDGEWLGEINRNGSEYLRWIQTSLNKLTGARLAVDGISGTYTRSAIRSFQTRVGLVADGIVGPLTESALLKAGASNPPGFQKTPRAPTTPPGSTPLSPTYISISSGVQLSPAIETALRGLDEHFKRANLRVTLTSGVRSTEKQLSIIREQAIKRGIDKKYPSIRTATVDNISSWQGAWEELLHVHKYIVNPPKQVESRIDGHVYPISPHMAGTAMDFSGADLDRIASAVKSYCSAGGVVSQILIERTNGAVHVGVSRKSSCGIEVT
jgi:peptidoglycan hydrolase-like protein with peptidoglycan-binding domain